MIGFAGGERRCRSARARYSKHLGSRIDARGIQPEAQISAKPSPRAASHVQNPCTRRDLCYSESAAHGAKLQYVDGKVKPCRCAGVQDGRESRRVCGMKLVGETSPVLLR